MLRVKSVTYAGKADVYNMEVDDTHDFVVNGGFVAHNCYDAVRYMCMAYPMATEPVKRYHTRLRTPYDEDGEEDDVYSGYQN